MLCRVWRLLGGVSAGFPSAAEGYEDEPLDLQAFLVAHPAATFFFRLAGDGLRDEGLRDGAVLVVDRSVTPRPGRLVLAEEDGGFVVCRFRAASPPAVVCGVVVAAVMRL